MLCECDQLSPDDQGVCGHCCVNLLLVGAKCWRKLRGRTFNLRLGCCSSLMWAWTPASGLWGQNCFLFGRGASL